MADERSELEELRRLDELEARAGKGTAAPTPEKKESPTKKFLQDQTKPNPLIEGTAAITSGALSAIPAGIMGIGTQLAGGNGGDTVRKVQEALTYQPKSESGGSIANAISYLPGKVAEGFDWLGGKVTDTAKSAGAPSQVAAALGAGTNAAGQVFAPSKIAQGIGKIKSKVSPKDNLEAARGAQVDKNYNKARKLGYVSVPSEAGAGPINRALESFAGSKRVSKDASRKNAPTTNNLIREDIGLRDDIPINRKELNKIIEDEGHAYEEVKGIGKVNFDSQLATDLGNVTKEFDTAAKDFSHRSENPFKKTLDGLTKNEDGMPKQFADAASIVEEIKLLRKDANKAFVSGDSNLGWAYKKASQAMDDMLDRHLANRARIQPDMADAFDKYQGARTRIAKAYAAHKALDEGSGNINADIYKRELDRGKPLSGGSRDVAEFATQFPESSKRVKGTTGPEIADAIMATVKGDAKWAFARPILSKIITSKPYQAAFLQKHPDLKKVVDKLIGAQKQPEVGVAEAAVGQRDEQRRQ